MKKAVILVRVSTVRQEQEGLSLDHQEETLRQYAKERELEISKVFRFSESADSKLRTNFAEMLAYVRKHSDIAAVIAYRVDRITRNYRDAVLIDELRLNDDKEIHFVHDRLVIAKHTVGREITEWDTKVYLAKQYINRLKEDAHDTASHKLGNKEWPGKAPYGYRNSRIDDKHTTVLPEEFEAGIVRSMFEWYGSGTFSMDQIRGRLKSEKAVSLSKGNIDQILKRRFYYGEMEYSGKVYPHKYEALITQELYDRVQDNKRSYGKKKFKFAGLPFPYRTIITCAACGCMISPERKIKPNGTIYNYYKCTQYHGKHNAHYVSEDDLTKQFMAVFDGLRIPEEQLEELVNALRESHATKTQTSEELRHHAQSEYNRREKWIESMYLDKLDGRITAEQFDQNHGTFRSEQAEFSAILQRTQEADEEYYITASYLLELAARAGELFTVAEPDEKRLLLKMVLQNCQLNQKTLVWELKKPFDTVFVCVGRQEWLLRLGSNQRHPR